MHTLSKGGECDKLLATWGLNNNEISDVSAAKQHSAGKQVDVPTYKCATNVSAPADGGYPE